MCIGELRDHGPVLHGLRRSRPAADRDQGALAEVESRSCRSAPSERFRQRGTTLQAYRAGRTRLSAVRVTTTARARSDLIAVRAQPPAIAVGAGRAHGSRRSLAKFQPFVARWPCDMLIDLGRQRLLAFARCSPLGTRPSAWAVKRTTRLTSTARRPVLVHVGREARDAEIGVEVSRALAINHQRQSRRAFIERRIGEDATPAAGGERRPRRPTNEALDHVDGLPARPSLRALRGNSRRGTARCPPRNWM